MQDEPLIELDHGPGGTPVRFAAPRAMVTAWEPAEVPGALAALDAALGEGRWIAGYAAYELGFALEPRLVPLLPTGRRLPLLEFGIFEGPEPVRAAAPGGRLGPFVPVWDAARHRAAFDVVAEYIRAGDIYQANLTFPLRGQWVGEPAAVQAALAAVQPVGHGALVVFPEATILSRSPELFFRLDAGGRIMAAPMKGTAPRAADPEADAALRAALPGDAKTQAENLMIVDLLRNDIGRIARIGSVSVPQLFAVETYATVHQLVSRVQGTLLPGLGFGGVLRALFPCGSVTGAPKIRAMEILREVEAEPREAYCGAIGWAGPDGRADFSVAIRSITLYPGGEAVLNVGGGIVAESTAEAEYEEALWKARFSDLSRPTCG